MPAYSYTPGQYMDPAVQRQIPVTLSTMQALADHAEDPNDNVVVSAHNILDCFTLVGIGADGTTKAEIAERLFLVAPEQIDMAISDFTALNNQMLANANGQVTLLAARTIWPNSDRGTVLLPAYEELVEHALGAKVDPRSFADPATVKLMNQWASDNTNGLITKIVDTLPSTYTAMLASALYFKGDWTSKFDIENTKPREFRSDNGVFTTPMMHREEKERDEKGNKIDNVLQYLQGDDFEAVAMTYGHNDWSTGKYPPVRMVMVRPSDEDVTARQWLASQRKDAVPAFLDSGMFEKAVGVFEMPRLDIVQSHDLKGPLQAMGVMDLFTPGASNLSRMFTNGAQHVDRAKHDVVFKTNELGSEAAAVTSMGFECLSIPRPPRVIDVRLNRSFLFAVQDLRTGGVLFSGIVNRPNKEMTPAI